jgi:hypothetical protein
MVLARTAARQIDENIVSRTSRDDLQVRIEEEVQQ